MLRKLLAKKPIQPLNRESSLYRTLTTSDLIFMGIGAIIGAGVFVLTGIAAATKAGPGIVISYFLASLASMFAALSYAELAASVGGTGSAYSYAYTGFGELIAWIIGWNLLLEYLLAVATVAIGWSGYVNNLFEAMHYPLPDIIARNPFAGGGINLFAFLIVILLSILLTIGVRLSAQVNSVIVFIKLLTILAFICVASMNVQVSYWSPFLPFGWTGVMQGAALVFFAYIGFDALSTAVEETIQPQKSIPIGIIASLIICTIIYIVVSGLLTGIVPYTSLNVRSPVSEALLKIGHATMAGFVAAGAIAGLTSVMLVMFYGLTRICLAMASDGLLPIFFSAINIRTRTPIRIISFLGILIAIIAGMTPINVVAELVNIGTLAAFSFVCLGVVILRITQPKLSRPFRLPFNPIIPFLGVISCFYLMLQLPGVTWWRFAIWTVVGIGVYFLYGIKHSVLRRQNNKQ